MKIKNCFLPDIYIFNVLETAVRVSVADPAYRAFSTLRSVMNIPDNFSKSLETVYWIKKTLIWDLFNPGFGIRDGKIRTGINIPDHNRYPFSVLFKEAI